MISHIKIGIDIGGVIIAQDTDEPDLFFTDAFLNAKTFPDCFETIKHLVQSIGRENVFIISKCGEIVQKKSREWLEHKDFFDITGFDPKNIYFCLERQDKAQIADKLGLTVFIDDRYTVLQYMLNSTQLKRLILFCPNSKEEELYQNNPNDKIIKLKNWEEILNSLPTFS